MPKSWFFRTLTRIGAGLPFGKILNTLNRDPFEDAESLGAEIVHHYSRSHGADSDESVTALRLEKVGDIAEGLDIMAHELIESVENRDLIPLLRARTASQYAAGSPFIDLSNLCLALSTMNSLEVTRKIAEAVILEHHGSQHGEFHGMDIYFPEKLVNYDSDYSSFRDGRILLSMGTEWDDFLEHIYKLPRQGNTGILTGPPRDILFINDSFGDGFRTITISPAQEITLRVDDPNRSSTGTSFVLYMWPTEADMDDLSIQPDQIGCACFPMPLSTGSPEPIPFTWSTPWAGPICSENR